MKNAQNNCADHAPLHGMKHAHKAQNGALGVCTIVSMGHTKWGMPLQRHASCQMPPTLVVAKEWFGCQGV